VRRIGSLNQVSPWSSRDRHSAGGIAITGNRPRWRERSTLVRWWRLWRTRRPVTFNEKVRYKMLRDHRPLVVTFADKVAVRSYIADAVGPQYLPGALHITHDPATLRHLQLPDRYVVKPSHGSGVVVIVSPDAPVDTRLPPPEAGWVYCHVRPDRVVISDLVTLCASWLDRLYGQGPNREWAYGLIPRQIIVEELLLDRKGEIPQDYKLFVFNGHCRYIQVDGGRFSSRTQDFFDPDWTHLSMSGGPPFATEPIAPPAQLHEMIDVAQRLAVDTDFVRVDLYVLDDRVVVGELTNYPAGGESPFYPDTFNTEFGRHWTVPTRYV
jgi:TupA-like ATPgrasp